MEILNAQILNPLYLSFKVICVSIVLFTVLGVPLAFILAKKRFFLKWLLEVIVTMPLIFPPIAVGFFLLLLLGKNGWIGGIFQTFNVDVIFSFSAICIAAFISGLPLMVKPLQSAIKSFPMSIKEASYISGKSEIKTFLCVVLPAIKNSFFVALLIATARALGEVGITLMLGGNIIGKTDTISLAIYNAVFDGDYELAMILSGILVSVSLIFFIVLSIYEKKDSIYKS